MFRIVLIGLLAVSMFVNAADSTKPSKSPHTAASQTADDEPAQLKGAKALKAADEAVRQQMMVISRQLGVTCTTCHTTKNFASNDKQEFKIAKEHMTITQLLIDHGFDGRDKRPKADCYMCHRGKLRPDYVETFDPMTMDKAKR